MTERQSVFTEDKVATDIPIRYSALAAAVINQAVKDLGYPTGCSSAGQAREARETAISFLSEPNDVLAFWCSVGDFDQNAVVEGARKLRCGPAGMHTLAHKLDTRVP